MPSDASGTDHLTARCYCGGTRLQFSKAPQAVAYCHCLDCRRWTGGPVAAFAAFENDSAPTLSAASYQKSGVERWTCPACGSPIAARFGYLPGQTYVPLGILDQAASLAPEIHCHTDRQLPWLHIDDDLPRQRGTARTYLATDTT